MQDGMTGGKVPLACALAATHTSYIYIYNYLYIFSIHIFFILPLIFLVCSLFHIYTKLVTTRYDKSEEYIGLPVFLSCFRLFVSDVCFLGIDVSSALATWI